MQRALLILIVAAAVALMPVLCARAESGPGNHPVPDLDIARYSGTWHEIAHLPMFFQRHCVDRITATYTPLSNGNLEVRNACRTRRGAMDASVGEAKPVPEQAGALQVRFAPRWLSWLPMVWADYWVVDLDPNYQWAVVGGPSRKYLWVLSREASMDRSRFEAIRQRAAERGYPVENLVLAAPLR